MILFLYFFVVYLVNIISCDELYQTTPRSLIRSQERSEHYLKLDLLRGSSIDQWLDLASDNVVYCRLYNSQRRITYDGFGRCRLSIKKVGAEHQGYWYMSAAYRGHDTFEGEDLFINVIEQEEQKTHVQTSIELMSENSVKVTCALIPTGYQIQACQFKSPRGPYDVQLVAFGATHSEGRSFTNYETSINGSDCSVQISNPSKADLGFWRCAMTTGLSTYYGFFTLLSSSFRNSSIEDNIYDRRILPGPEVTPDQERVIAYKDEPFTLSCSIFAPIKYCYFWMEGGTVLTVYPGLKSSSMEYVGAGFEAGECGLKINSFNYTQFNQRWRCVVALATGKEQSHSLSVEMRERMEVYQAFHFGNMEINARVADSELEYCRFIRDYEYAFDTISTDNIAGSPLYEFQGSLSQGSCRLRIFDPRMDRDYSPWTIVAKVKGQEGELSARTSGLPIPEKYTQYYYNNYTSGWEIFGWVLAGLALTGYVVGVAVGPKRHREWIAARAAEIREKFRKEPTLPNYTTL